ncbi:HAMP domain-containing methyl-accepting chemotaxis protein [Calothrix sp. NIES-2098]|uniref:HAMP domain-containing methyl-accepting chemotaxis protein n=1 Tax=Calothrix sp. NIES-2098 TaxID=1954171 RepID=UPI000B61B8E5|nr:methyl-accepting chemotaxis sensory transducer [Calothrix sp. NIES-2098]
MLNNLSLQKRLISGFSFIGAIVLVVALIGWGVNSRLSNAIHILSTNSIPSVIGLWKINEGQTQIESSERALLDPTLWITERNAEVARIKQAWEQIDNGFKQYDSTDKNNEEQKIYEELLSKWNDWKQNHEKLMQINQQFESLSILNPMEKELELIKQNKTNSPEMELIKKSKVIYEQLRRRAKDNRPSFEAATKLLLEDIKLNENLGTATYKAGQQDAANGSFLMIIALIIGPLTAITFGVLLSKPIVNKVNELVKISNNIATSNLNTQQSSESKDEIGKLQTAFYTVAAKIAELVNVAQKISTGDLTMQIQLSGHQDEISKLQHAFYTMNKDLNSLIRSIQQSGVQITTSSTQIAASGKQLEATVTEQLASTNEVTATAQEIAATSRNLVKMMDQVAEMTKMTATAASESRDELQEMENTMRNLTEATNSITSKLGVMNKKASNINSVVVTITKVADQTSILSLNAAIEAEKAGEYGAGFAVVAREIRRLANQTAVATLEIEQIVKDMQSAVSVGVMEMDKFSNSVNNSVEQVNKISNQISKVIQQVQSLPPQFEQVSGSMEEQSQGATQISEAMEQLSEASQQTVDALRETNSALEQLEDAAQSLRAEITHFKVQN